MQTFDVIFTVYLGEQPIRRWQMVTPQEFIIMKFLQTVQQIAGAQGIELVKANRGALMRSISAELKGKADMKIVSAVVGDILN